MALPSWSDYEKHLNMAVQTGYARLETAGVGLGNDPIYALTVSDFSVPDEDKYHILVAGLHVGGERAALHAFLAAIKWLTTRASRKYLAHFAVTFMPSINPYGCFRTDIDQQHLTPGGLDPYTGDHGKCFNYPALTLQNPDAVPELAAFLRTVDQLRPEILLDWHGANGRSPDEHMRETLGCSLSNQMLMPWGTRLLAAMRREICRGASAVFDLEEYLERIPAPTAMQEQLPNRFRPSGAFFYPDLYAYIKYHTMPVVMEIGLPETGWRALKGLMEFGLKPPPEYRGGFPVDHIGVDFGNLVLHAYGATPGMRRRSRAELQSKLDGMVTFYLNPMYIGRLGAVLAIGPEGLRRMIGDIPLRKLGNCSAAEFPASPGRGAEGIKSFLNSGREKCWLPLFTNRFAETPPACSPPECGLTLQMFIPLGHACKIRIREVLLNGMPLSASSADGYELVCGSDGWHLFVFLPPEKSRRENLYCLLAAYDVTAQ